MPAKGFSVFSTRRDGVGCVRDERDRKNGTTRCRKENELLHIYNTLNDVLTPEPQQLRRKPPSLVGGDLNA